MLVEYIYLPLCDELYACDPPGSVWKRACSPDHVASMVTGMAMAVNVHIPSVIWISSARGKRLTVTTAIMATKNPKDV